MADNGFACNRIGSGHKLGTTDCPKCTPPCKPDLIGSPAVTRYDDGLTVKLQWACCDKWVTISRSVTWRLYPELVQQAHDFDVAGSEEPVTTNDGLADLLADLLADEWPVDICYLGWPQRRRIAERLIATLEQHRDRD